MPMTGSRSANTVLFRVLVALLVAALMVGMPALTGAGPARADDSTSAPSTGTTESTTTAPALALGARTLRYGDTGADVKALQKLLKVKKTGTFNKTTRAAVKKAQRKAGIKANGVVGAKTLKAIKKQVAAAKKAAAAKKRAKKSSRSLPRAGTPSASRAYAKAYIRTKYGWGATQMSCLTSLWNRESGWRYRASNPNGRYHGIPQTSSAVWRAAGYTTAQYKSSPAIQIKVGTKYVKSRYGTPCRAWSFWRSHHWY